MEIALLDASHPRWLEELELFRSALVATQAALLFPPHFLRATFGRIGGMLAIATANQERVAAGFLFPRHVQAQPPQRRTYTLRAHWLGTPNSTLVQQLVDGCTAALDGAQVVYYDPAGPHSYLSLIHI